jgi:hypothetical protein
LLLIAVAWQFPLVDVLFEFNFGDQGAHCLPNIEAEGKRSLKLLQHLQYFSAGFFVGVHGCSPLPAFSCPDKFQRCFAARIPATTQATHRYR